MPTEAPTDQQTGIGTPRADIAAKRDDISRPMKTALEALATVRTAKGREISPETRTATWKSLQRYGLIRTHDDSAATKDSLVTITQAGLDSVVPS